MRGLNMCFIDRSEKLSTTYPCYPFWSIDTWFQYIVTTCHYCINEYFEILRYWEAEQIQVKTKNHMFFVLTQRLTIPLSSIISLWLTLLHLELLAILSATFTGLKTCIWKQFSFFFMLIFMSKFWWQKVELSKPKQQGCHSGYRHTTSITKAHLLSFIIIFLKIQELWHRHRFLQRRSKSKSS